VEAGDNYNPMPLEFEEYAIRKAPHSCAATVPMDDGELQWMFRD
jgi:hypothetical protein